jgi:uncharacterized protein YgfB (UPF0149 family)
MTLFPKKTVDSIISPLKAIYDQLITRSLQLEDDRCRLMLTIAETEAEIEKADAYIDKIQSFLAT